MDKKLIRILYVITIDKVSLDSMAPAFFNGGTSDSRRYKPKLSYR